MEGDELNEFLECMCGRCDDGRCRCSNDDSYLYSSYSEDELYYDSPIDDTIDPD